MKKIFIIFAILLFCAAIYPADLKGAVTKSYYLNYMTPKEFRYLTSKIIPNINIDINDEFKLVIITDNIENINIFENLLRQLDVKTPQIQIEAKIVETKLSIADKYGINWTWQDLLNNSNKEIKSFFENFLSTDSKFQGQFGTLRVDSFNIVLNFLLTQTNTDLLSSPKIVTLNAKEANINTGDQIPIKTTTTQGNVTVTTTIFKETGVKLKVTPFIKGDNFILLDVHPEVSEVLEYSTSGDPIISQRKVDGSVIVKDDETLMVGGLLRNKTLLSENKLPILGDIPLIGLLFRKQTTEKAKTEIIIFITPHIIKEGERLITPEEKNTGR